VAAATFDIERSRFNNRWMPAYNEYSEYAAMDGYISAHFYGLFGIAEVLKSALGEPAETNAYLANSGYYWIHRLEPDLWFSRNVAKWVEGYETRMVYASIFQGYLKNPYSRLWGHVADLCGQHYNQSYPSGEATPYTAVTAWLPVLYYDDTEPTETTADSLSYYDPSGLVFTRSGWEFGAASTDSYAMISSIPQTASGYRVGHFILTRGEDRLLTDSGFYRNGINEYDDHFTPYYCGCTGNNTIGIEVPGETSEWPDQLASGVHLTQNSAWGGTIDIPIDGACYHATGDSTLVFWPNTDFSCPSYGGVCRGYLGRIREFRDQALGSTSYVYTRLYMGMAYRFAADWVVREFIHIRPNLFVVRDVVVVKDPSYQVRTRFHSINRPEPQPAGLACGIVRELGAPWSADLGGVYRLPWVRNYSITKGASRAQVLFVRPTAQEGNIKIVGGPNILGQSYKQNWHAQVTNPLLVSPYTSYEFWQEDLGGDGKNYIPGTTTMTQADIDNRNAARSRYAADWRIQVESNTGTLRHEMIAVMPIGSTSMEDVTASYDDATSVLTIHQGADTYVIDFTTNGGLTDIQKL